MNTNINQAVETLKHGGIVIFPTDTAFGIGCKIDNEKAVLKLFEIRKRPKDKAVPILVSSIRMAEKYVGKINPDVLKLMKKYWPGGLTIILPCNDNVPFLVRGGGKTIGIRIPKHKTIYAIIKKLGVPILAPSANFSGNKTAFVFSDLDKRLVGLVDFVMAGRCTIKKTSTVIDCTKKPFKILRKGAVEISI